MELGGNRTPITTSDRIGNRRGSRRRRPFSRPAHIDRRPRGREVDDLVNKTLPKKVEEYLRGEAFEQEAEAFLNATIDNVMNRPLSQLIGQFEAGKFDALKAQVTSRLVEILRSETLSTSVSAHFSDAIDRLRPQTLGSVLQQVDPKSPEHVKQLLTRSLLSLLAREDTSRTINAILTAQVERLLIAPIGRLGDHVSENAMERASSALVEKITRTRQTEPVKPTKYQMSVPSRFEGVVLKLMAKRPGDRFQSALVEGG